MSEINIDVSAINKTINSLENADSNIKVAISALRNSLNNVPSEIKGKISGQYATCQDLLSKLSNSCQYASNGLASNMNEYIEYENNNETSESVDLIKEKNAFYWNYPTTTNGGMAIKADSSFFEKLGIGAIDGSIFTYNGYTYDTETGKLTYLGKSVYCGIYYPKDCENLNGLNVTTLLFGDGETQAGYSRYNLNSNVMDALNESEIGNLIIVPQSSNDPSKGPNCYTRDGMSEKIVNATNFANSIIGENDNRSNSIVGYSSGGFSALDIAATNGNKRYDTVVVVNSYLKTTGVRSDNPNSSDVLTQLSDVSSLQDKEIILMEAVSDGKNNGLNVKALGILKEHGCNNVTVITADENVINEGINKGFNTYKPDVNWVGHGTFSQIVRDSNIMSYLSNK